MKIIDEWNCTKMDKRKSIRMYYDFDGLQSQKVKTIHTNIHNECALANLNKNLDGTRYGKLNYEIYEQKKLCK